MIHVISIMRDCIVKDLYSRNQVIYDVYTALYKFRSEKRALEFVEMSHQLGHKETYIINEVRKCT